MQTKFGWCNFTFHKKDIFAITEVSQCHFRRSTSNSHRCPNTHLWVILPSPKTILLFLYIYFITLSYIYGDFGFIGTGQWREHWAEIGEWDRQAKDHRDAL